MNTSRPKSGVLLLLIFSLVLMAGILRSIFPVDISPHSVSYDINDTEPLYRVKACQNATLEQLILRSSDMDWRVRAGAYKELNDIAKLNIMPLRDTLLAHREVIVINWLNRNDPNWPSKLCEIYANPLHVEFGQTMVKHCLKCHVGPEPGENEKSSQCISCHADIHKQWSSSAHAQSLTHLKLPTIDPATRQPTWYDFGSQSGMQCIACHQEAGSSEVCQSDFEIIQCAQCHKETQAQWINWGNGPQPRRLNWPPSAIQFDGPKDQRSCTDCHMPDKEHRWTARRNIQLLQEGIDLSIQSDPQGKAQIVLTNLAGHSYPTGTTRRAIRLIASLDNQPEKIIAELSNQTLADQNNTGSPALGSGESRTFQLPGNPQHINAKLVYVRNRFSKTSYVVTIAQIQEILVKPKRYFPNTEIQNFQETTQNN